MSGIFAVPSTEMPKRTWGQMINPFVTPMSRLRAAKYQGGTARKRAKKAGYYGFGTKESKFHDFLDTGGVVVTAGQIQGISLIPANDTESGRIGRLITITSVGLKGILSLPVSADENNTTDVVKVWIVLDKQANGALPVTAHLLEDSDVLGYNNLTNSFRFKTLATKTIAIQSGISGNGTATQTGDNEIFFEMFKKTNIKMQFSASTGAITEINSNNLIVFIMSHSAVASLRFRTRVRFTG